MRANPRRQPAYCGQQTRTEEQINHADQRKQNGCHSKREDKQIQFRRHNKLSM